ncbi:hypothetical protein T459_17751 [Capsicum annuum]|uniref:Uncharacterized protein n=1 Tax=Capsicum annuum TaxID=4072 RepID=A0A2G2ZCJ3_CAPAN|nr:hypothetical protein T459_17751 [Capsicum annuum]
MAWRLQVQAVEITSGRHASLLTNDVNGEIANGDEQADGGSDIEHLGLQNIQASFMLASLLPSADIDPIGSISKMDLRTFQKWASVHLGYSSLAEIEAPPPTAEVEPIC